MVHEMRRIGLCRIAIAVVALALAASPLLADVAVTIRYVKYDAAGDNNGTSWTDAYVLLQSALDAASTGDEIWVAAGTYMPTNDYGLVATGTLVQDRLKHFEMKNGVGIYGGFVGTETQLSERNWTTNVTILSGDIGVGSDTSDNCYHVFYHPSGLNLDATAVLDGFTITAANATGDWPHSFGGGMYNDGSSPTVTNCAFSGNTATYRGGGMYNNQASPTVTNCVFSSNSAGDYGGGMENVSSSPAITNCTFSGNSASFDGGGMSNWSAYPTVTNCTFSGNRAAIDGGGMSNWSSSPTVANCILWGDSATTGAEVYNDSSSPTFRYCDIAGSGGSAAWVGAAVGTDLGGNIDEDPKFVSPVPSSSAPTAAGDYHLLWHSPCIDSGDGSVAPTTDKDGNPRHDDLGMPNVGSAPPWADMGAYEFQGTTGVIYVKYDAAGDNNGTSWTDAYVLLQSALDAAVSGDDIWVAAGTYKPTSDYGLVASGSLVQDRLKHFEMKNGVGIYGGFAGTETVRSERNWTTNVTILSGDPPDPGNCYHVFYHSGLNLDSTAVVDGFTITGGNANGVDWPYYAGGGMYNDSSSPTVTNCAFSGNSAYYYGGGMFNGSSSPTVTDCTFSSNSAGDWGGGMCNFSSSPPVTNCTFSGNFADWGGGMYNYYSSPPVTNCAFSGNSADYYGGGMYNYWSSPTVANCAFSGNSTDYGGGMFNDGSSPTVTNCAFSGNTATYRGGGMFNNSNFSPTVTNCAFSGNSTDYGGGMFNDGYSSPTVTNCAFSGNTATTSGGGMYNVNSSSPTVTNCILWGDSAPTGAEVFNNNSSPTFSYCDVQGGYGGTGNVNADPLFVNAGAGDYHLAANSPCIDSANGSVAPATDKDGSARHDDSGMPNVGIGPPWADMGAYEFQGTSPARIHVKQDATGANTGASWTDAFVLLQSGLDAAVSGDEIWVAAGTYMPTSDYGLGIGDRGMHFEMKNGVSIYGGFAGTETLLSQRNWTTNVTTLSGDIGDSGDSSDNCCHVFYHYGLDLDGPAVLDGFTVAAGNATGAGDWPHNAGGGMHNDHSSPTVTNCVFSGNSVQHVGGGITNYYSSPTLTNCTFSGNSAELAGGGMYNYMSSPTVTSCTFSDNSAAAFGGGGMHNEYSSPTVTNCVFTGNYGMGSSGGGMTNNSSSPHITNCVFIANSAWDAGGMYNENSSPTVADCTFSGNSAGGNGGGGIFNNSSSSTITNCTFSANSVTSDYGTGGGMYNYNSSPSLVNCTFSGNSAHYGDEMGNAYSSPTVTNCILWGDSAPTGAEVYNGNSTPTFTYSDIAGCGGSGQGWDDTVGTDGGGNVDADPLFVNAVTGDLHLTAGSPCIDSADGTAAPATDIEGSARHDDPGMPNVGVGPPWADMGAYEFQGTTDTRPLSVHSTPFTGVGITSATDHDGTTDYEKAVNTGASVTLTAPAAYSVDDTGYHFVQWTGTPDGTVVSDGGRTITFSIQEDATVTAEYAIDTWTLSVQSTPITGVAVTGDKPGSTNYTAACDDEQEVTLTAPLEAGGKYFRCWQTAGAALLSRARTLTIVVSAGTTVVAVYTELRVLAPSDSGITVEIGKPYNIEWSSNLPKGAKVKIELVKGSGGTWTLSKGVAKSPFKWTVGKAIKGVEMYTNGKDYKVRVSALVGSAWDESDNDFSIGSVDLLTVTGPPEVTAGTPAQYACTAHYDFGEDRVVTNEVKWTCSKIRGVKIGKTGLLTTAPGTAAPACTITASYGKGKSPITGPLGITITP